MQAEHLPFWSFFHAVEKELSYERWIDKYLLLLKMLRENYVEYDEDWSAFKNCAGRCTCRISAMQSGSISCSTKPLKQSGNLWKPGCAISP